MFTTGARILVREASVLLASGRFYDEPPARTFDFGFAERVNMPEPVTGADPDLI